VKVAGGPTRTIWPSADGTTVEIIDQTRLPHAFVTTRPATLDDTAHAIRVMLVRGAPLIGATAAWGLWLALPLRVVTRGPVRLTPGGTTRIQISAPYSRNAGNVHFELFGPPEGISIEKSYAGSGDIVNVLIACDPAKIKPGTQGNLLLHGYGDRSGPAATKAKAAPRVLLGTVPAIPLEVGSGPAPASAQ
jgi:hypothetical protein